MRPGLSVEPYAAAMIACALVSLLLSARSFFGTRRALARSFAFLQATVFIWSLFRLVQWEILSPEGQLEALKLQYFGVAFLPAAYYFVAKALAKKPARGIEIPLLFLPGLAVVALVEIPGLNQFFWKGDGLSALPINPEGSWGFWAFIAHAFALVIVALLIIVRVCVRARGMAGRAMRYLAVLLALPVATSAIFVLIFFRETGYDPAPIAYAVSGCLIALVLRRFDLLDSVPYAKNVLLESLDSPLIAVDSGGLVVGANEEAKRLAPSIDLLEGRPIEEIVPVLGGKEAEGDAKEWSLGGVDYQITCHEIRQRGKLWKGRFYLFRDVSAIVRARREMEEARRRADEYSAAKSTFVATVSHELRNPLNAIIGLTDLNLRAGPPPEVKDDLEVILSSANILLGLVNDLLDLSKIEAGKMELERIDFDLHEKAASMLKSFRPVVEKKGVFLDISIEEGTPRYVKGDPLRYGQVLMNLVSNAVKFTQGGAVTVSLAALRPGSGEDPDGDPRSLCVLTAVRDSGMGIAPELLPKLFQEFSQGDPSVGRRFGGTGLGLSISKRLVELFGGKIEVKSIPGKGSAFSFTARFEPSDESGLSSPAGAEAAPVGGPSLRVLVVDDDPINAAVARRYLERRGHSVAAAGNGGEAMDRIGRGAFDLVLLDLGLPDMDGFEACRLIRAKASARPGGEPQVAAMTARAESGVRAACASAGMIDCLAKPLDPAALYRLLDRTAEGLRAFGPRAASSVQASRLEDAEDAGREAPPSSLGTPLIDEATLLEGLDGDRAFMRELLGYFIEEAEDRRAAIERAVAERDLESLQRLCHALKGSSLTLRADPLGGAAAAVELACLRARRGGHEPESVFGPGGADLEGLLALLYDTVGAAKAILEAESPG